MEIKKTILPWVLGAAVGLGAEACGTAAGPCRRVGSIRDCTATECDRAVRVTPLEEASVAVDGGEKRPKPKETDIDAGGDSPCKKAADAAKIFIESQLGENGSIDNRRGALYIKGQDDPTVFENHLNVVRARVPIADVEAQYIVVVSVIIGGEEQRALVAVDPEFQALGGVFVRKREK